MPYSSTLYRQFRHQRSQTGSRFTRQQLSPKIASITMNLLTAFSLQTKPSLLFQNFPSPISLPQLDPLVFQNSTAGSFYQIAGNADAQVSNLFLYECVCCSLLLLQSDTCVIAKSVASLSLNSRHFMREFVSNPVLRN